MVAITRRGDLLRMTLQAFVMFVVLSVSPVEADSLASCTARDGSAGLKLALGCTSFEAESVEILGHEVADLHFFPSARSVTVNTDGTAPADLSVLQALPRLEKLYAVLLTAESLEPLGDIRSLTQLGIGFEDADLAPIARLENLTFLALRSDEPIDLAPLAGLPELTRLRVDSRSHLDASGLRDLPELRHLLLSGMVGRATLQGIPKLRSLAIYDSEVSDAAPVCDLSGLRSLDVRNVRMAEMTWLGGCGGLERLRLVDLGSRDISAVAHLEDLRDLSLDGTLPQTLAPLRDLPNLERLSLRGVSADLSPLKEIPSLSSLVLPDGTQVEGQEAIMLGDFLR